MGIQRARLSRNKKLVWFNWRCDEIEFSVYGKYCHFYFIFLLFIPPVSKWLGVLELQYLSILLCVWALSGRYVLNCSAFCNQTSCGRASSWGGVSCKKKKKKEGLLSSGSKSQWKFTQSYRWKYIWIHIEIHQIKICTWRSVFWQFLELKKKVSFHNPVQSIQHDPCFLKFLITNNQT